MKSTSLKKLAKSHKNQISWIKTVRLKKKYIYITRYYIEEHLYSISCWMNYVLDLEIMTQP